MLATLSAGTPVIPFGSIMPYALDEAGQPLVLISTLAMHTQKPRGRSAASLLVVEPTVTEDALAAGGTLMGEAARIAPAGRGRRRRLPRAAPQRGELGGLRGLRLLAAHRSRRVLRRRLRRHGLASARDYAAARPDPLAHAATDVLEHMNRDHADALLTFARVLAREEAEEARMVAVDRLGFKLRLRTAPVCRVAASRSHAR